MSQNSTPLSSLLQQAKALISRIEGIKWDKAVRLIRARAQEGTSEVPMKALYSILYRDDKGV